MEDIIDITGLSYTACLQQERHFVDHTFVLETENHFRYRPRVDSKQIQYKRITDMPQRTNSPPSATKKKLLTLFGKELSPHDIVQGILPNCFFITACSILASRPQLLKKLFITKEFSSRGLYCLKFYQQGEWRYVIVDDVIPCSTLDPSCPLFSKSRNENEIWPQILEKAYAKLYGSYDSLNGGNVSEALVDLTGCPVEDFNLERPDVRKSIKDGSMWSNLKEWIRMKYLVACTNSIGDNLDQSENEHGIINNHAYGILDIIENKEKFVMIRNPHGYSDVLGSEKLIKLYNLPPTSDGCSWLKFSDFTKYFNRLYCCKIFDEEACSYNATIAGSWQKGTNAGGCTLFASFRQNPMVQICTNEPVSIFLTLQQTCQRRNKRLRKEINYPQIGLTVIQVTSIDVNPMCLTPNNYKTIYKTSFWNKREVSAEINLNENVIREGPIFLVPSSYFPDQEASFTLHARSLTNKSIVMKIKDSCPIPERKVSGKWTMCGGAPSSASFYRHPYFYIRINKPNTEVCIFLEQEKKANHEECYTIGLYVIRNGTDRLESMTTLLASNVLDKIPFTRAIEISKSVLFNQPGDYIVVPCIYQINTNAPFILSSFSRDEGVQLLNPRDYQPSVQVGTPEQPSTKITRQVTSSITCKKPSISPHKKPVQTRVTTGRTGSLPKKPSITAKHPPNRRSDTLNNRTLSPAKPRDHQSNIVADLQTGKKSLGIIASLYSNLDRSER